VCRRVEITNRSSVAAKRHDQDELCWDLFGGPAIQYLLGGQSAYYQQGARVNKRLTLSDIVILVSGVVLLIASFLPWIDWGSRNLGPFAQQLQQLGLSLDIPTGKDNAWDHFPGFLYPAIAGTLAAIYVVLTKLAGTRMGDNVAGFSWTQIHLLLGAWAVLSALAVALEDFSGADKSVGLWLSLGAAVGLLAGAVLRTGEPAVAPTTESSAA
jgi:hypothetical protein